MTVIHIIIGFGGGGMENFVLHLSKRYVQRNIKTIAVAITPQYTWQKEFEQAGISCVNLKINSFASLLSGFRQLYQLVKQTPDAFIHAHGFHALMLGIMLRLCRPKLPMVFTLHNNFIKKPYRRFILFFTRMFRKADIIFSEDAKAWYHKSRSVVIANGVDTDRYQLQKNPAAVFTFLFVGRLEEAKNPLFLVDLAKELKNKGNFKIAVAGTGSLLSSLNNKIQEFKLQDCFEYLGYRKDMPELLAQSHCVIMPSLWEGMPIIILEAAAAGIPIISTPVGSIPTILNSQNSNLGSLQDFPRMMNDVLHNYGLAQQKAEKLQQLVQQKFSIEASARKHLELYYKFYNN